MTYMTDTPTRIAFVCEHGAAKSVIAAEHYRALAANRGRTVVARPFGIDPDPEVPSHVVEGLRRDGIDVSGRSPARLSPESLADADLIVVIGCELPAAGAPSVPVVRWDGVPAVSDGYDVARAVIVERVQRLLDEGS